MVNKGMGWGWRGRGMGLWPGRGPFSYLPPWQRPGWWFGRGACWWLFGAPWWSLGMRSYYPYAGLGYPFYNYPTYYPYYSYYPYLW
jgi:hypothetical protein